MHIPAGAFMEAVRGHLSAHPCVRETVYECGFLRTRHPMSAQNRPHRLWTMTICLKGRGEMWHRGRWCTVRAGTAHLVPPGPEMQAVRTVRGQSWEIVWVRYLPAARRVTSLFPKTQPVLQSADGSELRKIIHGLHTELRTANDPLVLQHWVALLELHTQRLLTPRSAGRQMTEPRMEQLWNVVAAELARPWTTGDMAAIVNVSEQHLRRLCAAQTGASPMRYLTRLRLERAAALLTQTIEPISDIAQRVGFGAPFAFSRAFARQFGRSPSAYRSQLTPAFRPQPPGAFAGTGP